MNLWEWITGRKKETPLDNNTSYPPSDVLDTPTFARPSQPVLAQQDDPNAPDPLLDQVLPKSAIPRVAPRVTPAIDLSQSAPVAAQVAVAPATMESFMPDGIATPPEPATHAPTIEQTASALETAQVAAFPPEGVSPTPAQAGVAVAEKPNVPAFIDTADRRGADGKVYITIGLAPELVVKLDELVAVTRTTRADIVRKACGVIDLVIKGRRRQLRLGLVDQNGMLQNPIDGLER